MAAPGSPLPGSRVPSPRALWPCRLLWLTGSSHDRSEVTGRQRCSRGKSCEGEHKEVRPGTQLNQTHGKFGASTMVEKKKVQAEPPDVRQWPSEQVGSCERLRAVRLRGLACACASVSLCVRACASLPHHSARSQRAVWSMPTGQGSERARKLPCRPQGRRFVSVR